MLLLLRLLATQLQQTGALLGCQGDRRRVAAALRAVAGSQRRHRGHVAQSAVVVGRRRAEQTGRSQSEVTGAGVAGRLAGGYARPRVGYGRYPADGDERPTKRLVGSSRSRLRFRRRRRVGHAHTLQTTRTTSH